MLYRRSASQIGCDRPVAQQPTEDTGHLALTLLDVIRMAVTCIFSGGATWS